MLKTKHAIIWLPVVLYYAFISFLSSRSDLGINPFLFEYADKVIHFCEYFILGIFLARSLAWEARYHHMRRRWRYLFLLVIPVLGISDEIHQLFVPNRMFDLLDFTADVLGAYSGLIVAWKIYKKKFHLQENAG
ncbi:VanZ family protein [bacterium]|nr:VanZ family protein [bacterium]